MTSSIEHMILENNNAYVQEYKQGGLPLPPSKKTTIVICMDARLDPNQAYGLHPGEVNVIRNGGGSAQDALRSILISNHLLGTENVLIIKHTRCGLLGGNNEMARKVMAENLGGGPEVVQELEKIDFLPIADLEKAAREDVEYLRDHKLVSDKVHISGWLHDTDTGKLQKVVS